MTKLLVGTEDEKREIYKQRVRETFKLDPTVTVTLKGQDYKLEFNNYAAKHILLDVSHNLINQPLTLALLSDPVFLGAIFWRGLETNHPELGQEGADKLLTAQHFLYIVDKIKTAVTAFMPDMSDVEVTEPDGTDAPTDPPKP